MGKEWKGRLKGKLKRLSCLVDMGRELKLMENELFGMKNWGLVKWEYEVKYQKSPYIKKTKKQM